jgi:hypothetical protein
MRPIRATGSAVRVAVAAAATASIACGCGHTTVVGGGRTLRLALSEYRVNPQSVRAYPGSLTIFVRNDGRLTHNLAVSRNGNVVAATAPLHPGQATVLSVSLAPGKYQIGSTLFSDQVLGLYGTLTVGP